MIRGTYAAAAAVSSLDIKKARSSCLGARGGGGAFHRVIHLHMHQSVILRFAPDLQIDLHSPRSGV